MEFWKGQVVCPIKEAAEQQGISLMLASSTFQLRGL